MGVNELESVVISDGLELSSSSMDVGFLSPPSGSRTSGLFPTYCSSAFSFSSPDEMKFSESGLSRESSYIETKTANYEQSFSGPVCLGCGKPILDQYFLRVAPNLEWHARCLKCAACGQFLDESGTCFVRSGKIYCKHDYNKLFKEKCNKCGLGFKDKDLVMRAVGNTYHVDCFRCATCKRQLYPGDEFALREDQLLCRMDYDLVSSPCSLGDIDSHHQLSSFSPPGSSGQDDALGSSSLGGLHTPGSGLGSQQRSGSGQKRKDTKTTRVRTVLNEKQLHTLRTCYAANCRPDALMKEQLTEMTGLSARVIRVWFQNKRCKDKKRSLALKQMQDQQTKQQKASEQNGNGKAKTFSCINGVPMIASEPVRNDSANPQPVEVRNYQQPAWKAFNEFELQSNMEQSSFSHFTSRFSDQGQSSISDSSEICSIPSVSSASMDIGTSCSTPLTVETSTPACG